MKSAAHPRLSNKNLEEKLETLKYTKLVRNLKGFFNKKKKIIFKKKNENDIPESEFFKKMKEMMVLCLKKEDAIKYFKKDRLFRAEIETRSVADYLTQDKKNIFLNNIRKISKGKLYNLIQNLNIEYYKKKDFIFQYKESLNKFYIILEGTISLYLPYFIKKNMAVKEFLSYFFYIKSNFPKSFVRVEKKNEYLFDGIYQLKINEYKPNCFSEVEENQKQDFYIEEYQNVYNIHEGHQVNQISLLYNLLQNFNGYAKTDVYLLSLNKSDFMHILRICLEEDLSKEFGKLRRYCYIFNSWNNYSLAQIMNYYIPFKTMNEEYLYKQKDESDCFYIIQDGIFEVYCELSPAEFTHYKNYILKKNKNVIEWIKEQKEKKMKLSVEKIIDYINWKIKKEEYPEEKETIDKNNIYIQKTLLNRTEENDDNLINLKVNEEILKEKNKKAKIKLFTLQKNDYIGLGDSIELKSRFYTVQCISKRGVLNKIRILDFIVFISSNHGLNLENVLDYVKERKNKIIERIHINLNRELDNSKRTINNAYSIAFSSYEKRKKFAIKIKTDNIFYINYMNKLNKNKNKNLIQKIKQLNELNHNNAKTNAFIKYKDINIPRKKSAGIRRYYLLNQFMNIEKPKTAIQRLKWNFYDENDKSKTKLSESNKNEKNRRKVQNNISSFILTTSNTDRRSKIISNNRTKRINNIYYLKNNTFSNSKKNLKKQFPQYNLTTTTLYSKNYDLIKNKDSSFNSKYEKEILNMTGIYNTKREKSKKKKATNSTKQDKRPRHILNNFKLSYHSMNKKKENLPIVALLSITNISEGLQLKNNACKNIASAKQYK